MRVRFWREQIVCQQWVELVTDYLDGALPPRLARAIDRHLEDCPHCREYLAQMRLTIELTGRLATDDEPPADLLAALDAALAERASAPEDD